MPALEDGVDQGIPVTPEFENKGKIDTNLPKNIGFKLDKYSELRYFAYLCYGVVY